jgi:hypothetical protein
MESIDNKPDFEPYKLYNKKHKMISSISNSVFIIHGIVILIVLAFILFTKLP